MLLDRLTKETLLELAQLQPHQSETEKPQNIEDLKAASQFSFDPAMRGEHLQ
jgi:hypothetical protein